MNTIISRNLFLVALALLVGCSTAYYNTMEKLGVHKREILVDRVEDARQAQKSGEKQFTSALEQFKSVVEIDGGSIQDAYDRLNSEYRKSQAAADKINERINDIESVSKALFKEWREETRLYSSGTLRRESEAKLRKTQRNYTQLIDAMKKAEALLDPVLATMNDQVLFLKHNLNARAIGSLRKDVMKIDKDVDVLVNAMRQAIAEADVFINNMRA